MFWFLLFSYRQMPSKSYSKWKLTCIWRPLEEFKNWIHIQTKQKKWNYARILKFLGIFMSNKVSFCESWLRLNLKKYVVYDCIFDNQISKQRNSRDICFGLRRRAIFMYYCTYYLLRNPFCNLQCFWHLLKSPKGPKIIIKYVLCTRFFECLYYIHICHNSCHKQLNSNN